MNMASLWALPLLVVVENNGYSQSTPIRLNMAGDIASRFAAFGIETAHIDSTDVLEIDAAAAQQVAAVRTERRPRGQIIDT
jgi:pyruvate dehydrogenase E1 component alpha subunit